LTLDSWRNGQDSAKYIQNNNLTKEGFLNNLDASHYLEFNANNISMMSAPFINSYGNFDYI
ncbi:MAG TPA: hypothetical protein DCY20_03930, partial [Firmicutes bacterium]|nr:hypothetical protein [Bacillota bacterium]